MNTANVITFDISSSKTGVFDGTNHFLLINQTDYIEFFKNLEDKEYCLVFETPKVAFAGCWGFGKQKQTLGFVYGLLATTLKTTPHCFELQASQWKRFYNFEKKSGKNQSIKLAKDLYNKTFETDDEADAFLMYQAVSEDKLDLSKLEINEGKGKKNETKSKKVKKKTP